MENDKGTTRTLTTKYWLGDKVRWENEAYEVTEVRITKEGISYQLSQNSPVNRTVAYVGEGFLAWFNSTR